MEGSNVKQVFCSTLKSYILKSDGSLVSYGEALNEKLIIHNPSIKFFNQTEVTEWTPDTHCLFSTSFKSSVFGFVCCLKLVHKKNNLKIPKFILYEIVKFAV